MDTHELDALLMVAEDEQRPLHQRRGVVEKLEKAKDGTDVELSQLHRIEKARHALRRELNLVMR